MVSKTWQDKHFCVALHVFKSGVNLNTRIMEHFILKSDEMCHFLRSPWPLILLDRVMVLVCRVLHLLNLRILNHKPPCNKIHWIGGLWPKFTTPWIGLWKGRVNCADNLWKYSVYALFVLYCSRMNLCISIWQAAFHGQQTIIHGWRPSIMAGWWPTAFTNGRPVTDAELRMVLVGQIRVGHSVSVQLCKQRPSEAKQWHFGWKPSMCMCIHRFPRQSS